MSRQESAIVENNDMWYDESQIMQKVQAAAIRPCRNAEKRGQQNMSKTIDYFLQYVKIDTQSDETTGTSPSTTKQHDLAKLLAEQLKDIGATEITYDREHCYVYATVPASEGCEDAPVLGLIAHMDTSPAVSNENTKPRLPGDGRVCGP